MTAPVLATAFATANGFSWWQSLGGLVAVLVLLVAFLKLLARFNRRLAADEASLLKVWALGPRREIQVLRLGDEVHFIYRHDGAMVLLKRQPHDEFVREHGARDGDRPAGTWQKYLPRSLDLSALRPGSGRTPAG